MDNLFTAQELDALSTRVDEQLRTLGVPGTGLARGRKPAQALGDSQRHAIEQATGEEAMSFLARFKEAAHKDLCVPGGVLYTQWKKWRDLANKACELGLRFDDPGHVVVSLNEDGQIQSASPQPFTGPLDQDAQRDLQWYLEVYPVQYTTELDDERAARIAQRITGWGDSLFNSVFADREAQRLLNRFQDAEVAGRLVTVSSGHPAVLAQPWELLRDPKGTYLFLDEPRISVRRQLSGTGGGRRPFRPVPKERLHLLFVICRPKDARFIDPRADPQAVMDAIDEEAPGRVTYEFLRPATVSELMKRLEDATLPPIDVIHFDGHGVYDFDGRVADRAKHASFGPNANDLLRDAPAAEAQQGYLWFENEDGTGAPLSASMLGDILQRKRVGLIVLSACQSAMVGGDDPMGSVAARLIHAGLPSVIAMTHSVLVATTRALIWPFLS